MLKFATKFALAVSLLGAMAAPTLAGPPKGMGGGSGGKSSGGMSIKSGPALNSSRNFSSNLGSSGLSARSLNSNLGSSSPSLSRSLNNNQTIKAPQGLSNQGLGGGFKLAERSNGKQTIGIKPIGNIKTKPIDSGIGNGTGNGIGLGNLGGNKGRDLKPLKNLDPKFGLGGNKQHDLKKPFRPLDPGFGIGGNKHNDLSKHLNTGKHHFDSLKNFQHNGKNFPGQQAFCGPNNYGGPQSSWGCGGFGGIFGSGFGCWNPGYGCYPNYQNWYSCNSWYNYCPSYSYCPPIYTTPIYTTPIYTTPVVVNSTPIVANNVGDIMAPPPVAPIETVNAAPINDVAPAAPAAPPAPAAAAAPATGIDLQVDSVVQLEAGDLSKNVGPMIRVSLTNKGTAPAGKFALGVYASLKEEPSKEMIPSGQLLEDLAAGQTRSIDIRLPVETLGMTAEGSTTKEAFKQLFIVADVQNEVTESNKQNNILPIKRDQLAAK